jgi:hypothetical protein
MYVAVLAAAGAALALAVAVAVPALATPPPPTPTGSVPGSYTAVGPVRLFDTRSGLDTARAVLGANAQRVATVLGRAGVPSANVSAVLVNITALAPTAAGGVTVWADGTAKPATSNLSFSAGVSAADLVLVRVGGDGRIRFANISTGTVHLVGDLAGYYLGGSPPAAPGTTVATAPARVLDTRTTVGGHHGAVSARSAFSVAIGGHAGVPSGAAAVVVTITALNPGTSGSLTAWKAGTTRPATTNLSLSAHRTKADLAVVPLGSGASISIWNNTGGPLHVIGDVTGYVVGGSPAEGGTFSAVQPPTRSLDTRTSLGGHAGALAAASTYALPVTGRAGVPATNVTAVAMTVTAIAPAVTGGLVLWADGYGRPGAGSMSFAARQTTSALVVAPVGPDGKVDIYNASGGSVHLVADVLGYVRADRLPIVASTSHFVRNLTGASSDATTMQSEGCADATANLPGIQHLVLLHIGAQNLSGSTWRVVLSATSTVLTDAQLVSAVNGYVDGYASCRAGTDPVTIAIDTNNDGGDGARSTAAGTEWANGVVDVVAAHAAGVPGTAGMVIAGADDIEWGFTGTEAEAEAWTRAFLAATPAPYYFTGSADACPSNTTNAICPTQPSQPSIEWSQANYYNLAHGISPSRILALPQIYYPVNAQQWKYISLTGASGADRVTFAGTLTEYAACGTPGAGCSPGYSTPDESWQALRDALSSSTAISLQRLPISTDLRIDTAPGATLSANRVTTAGVH